MAHGYLGDGYGSHGEIDPDRGGDRGSRQIESDWRDRRYDPDREMMFGDRRDRELQGRNRGWQGGLGGHSDYAHDHRTPSANPDDHYRSWRDRHMGEVDRDYEEYCREREQQFHRDFDEWRRNRRPSRSDRDAAVAEGSELELTHERALAGEGATPSPISEATLGTNNSENRLTGRARPRR